MKLTKTIILMAAASYVFLYVSNLSAAIATPSIDKIVQSPEITNSSYNWAGYVATGATFTQITGTWTVPNITASTNLAADAAWVGIGGVDSADLIQAGTQAISGIADRPVYQAWIETLPNVSETVNLAVSPGDSVSLSINQTGTNLWQIRITNNTTGKEYSTDRYYASSLSSAEWVEEMPASSDGLIPLADFGQVNFSNATTVRNGILTSADKADAQPLNMTSARGQTLAQVSTLGNDGASFAVLRTQMTASTNLRNENFQAQINRIRPRNKTAASSNFWQLVNIPF